MIEWILIIFTTFNGVGVDVQEVRFDNLFACKSARLVVEQDLPPRSNVLVSARCVPASLPREMWENQR